MLLTLVILLHQSKNNTINKKKTDKLLLIPKKLLINGEQDSPQAQDLCRDQTLLMLILMELDLEISLTTLRLNIQTLRTLDPLLLTLKRNLMHGEMDGPLIPDQSSLMLKLEKFQMVTLSIMESSLILYQRPKWKLRNSDKLL